MACGGDVRTIAGDVVVGGMMRLVDWCVHGFFGWLLFNIVGHNIDCNYESWKYMGQKKMRNRLAPGRVPSFPHPGVRRVFRCCSNNAHIFHISRVYTSTVLTGVKLTRCNGLRVYAVCGCNKVRLPGTGQSAHVIGGARFTRPASNSRRTLLN